MSYSNVNSLQVGPGLVQIKAVGGNVPSVITPVEFYSLQSGSFDIDQKIASASGSFKMPFDSAPVDMSIKGTLELLELKGAIFENLITADTHSVGGNVESYKESYTLASSSVATWTATHAYTVGQMVVLTTATPTIVVCTVAGTSGATAPTAPTTLGGTVLDGATLTWAAVCLDTGAPPSLCIKQVAQVTTFAEDLGVQYQSNNNPFQTLGGAQGSTPLPAPPTVGQYICVGTTGFYAFNATDAVAVFINYAWTSSTLVNSYPIMNHWIGWGPICEVNMEFPYQSVDTQHVLVGIHLVATRFGSQKVKTKRDGYATVTYDFEAFCPANNVAGYLYLPD